METLGAAASIAGAWLIGAVVVSVGGSLYGQAPVGGVALIVAGLLFVLAATASIVSELR